jgi:hypothetical protein
MGVSISLDPQDGTSVGYKPRFDHGSSVYRFRNREQPAWDGHHPIAGDTLSLPGTKHRWSGTQKTEARLPVGIVDEKEVGHRP